MDGRGATWCMLSVHTDNAPTLLRLCRLSRSYHSEYATDGQFITDPNFILLHFEGQFDYFLAARPWSYLVSAIKLICRGAPQNKVRGSEATEDVFCLRTKKPFNGTVRTGFFYFIVLLPIAVVFLHP